MKENTTLILTVVVISLLIGSSFFLAFSDKEEAPFRPSVAPLCPFRCIDSGGHFVRYDPFNKTCICSKTK